MQEARPLPLGARYQTQLPSSQSSSPALETLGAVCVKKFLAKVCKTLGSGALWAWMGCKGNFATHKPLRWAKNPTLQTAAMQDATRTRVYLELL
jgi:hypothetical protein